MEYVHYPKTNLYVASLPYTKTVMFISESAYKARTNKGIIFVSVE